MVSSCKGFWQCVTPDAWVQSIGTLLGAFVGALIAGVISVMVFKSSLKQQDKRFVQHRYGELMKFLEEYKRTIYPMKNNLDLIDEHIKYGRYEELEDLVELNFTMFKDLNKINTSDIDFRALEIVNLINRNFEFIMFQLLWVIKEKDQEKMLVTLETFEDNIKELKNLISDLEDYENELGKVYR